MTKTDAAARADAALKRLEKLHPKLIDLGLERTLSLLELLGNPHHQLPPTIHLAGTNGKGSVLAFLKAMLEAEGLKVHAYTSPHLISFNERICLAGKVIDNGALATLLEEVEEINGKAQATFFEITTAAAMLAFSRSHADILLLETGLGGRVDSTNVIAKPLASVITPIAFDHERFLGKSLTAIAKEKAGIMRTATPVFSAKQQDEVASLLIKRAEKIGTSLHLAERDFEITHHQNGIRVSNITIPKIGLLGAHQGENAGLAAVVLKAVMPQISDGAIIQGAERVKWFGRMQEVHQGALKELVGASRLFVDGTHNAHGAKALAETLTSIGDTSWVLVGGALNTRSPIELLKPLEPKLCHAITLAIPNTEASLSAEDMRKAAEEVGVAKSETATDIFDALKKASMIAKSTNSNIIISGSLYLAGHALANN